MENKELERILKKDNVICTYFEGVFNLDNLPQFQHGRLYIINLATKNDMFGHFVLIHSMCRNRVEYLCSAKTDFNEYPPLKNRLKLLSNDVYTFPSRVQLDNTTSCSVFCLFFAFMVTRTIYGPQLYKKYFLPYKNCVYKAEIFVCEVTQRLFKLKKGYTQSLIVDLDFLIGQRKQQQQQEQQQQQQQQHQ